MDVETPLPVGTLILLSSDPGLRKEARNTVGVVTTYQHDADLGWMHCLLVCGDFVWARECDLGEVVQWG